MCRDAQTGLSRGAPFGVRHWPLVLLSITLSWWTMGCAGQRSTHNLPTITPARAATAITADKLRGEVTSLADTYVTMVVQGLDQVRTTSKRSEVVTWAMQSRIDTAMGALTNASSPSSAAGLMDMIVYAVLKRIAVEEHWGPTLLKEEVGPVLAACRRGEEEAWAAARRSFSKPQVEQLRGLIEEWRKAHPGQFYVGHIRFAEFAKYRGVSADSPEARMPDNLFGVLYMDPLAGMDAVVREAHDLRLLMERTSYVAMRMPYILAWQVDSATRSLTSTPEMKQVAQSTENFSNATASVAKTTSELPTVLAAERTAAINQIADQLEHQRKGIVTDLNQQEQNLTRILKDVGGLITQADQTVKSVNSATTETVARSELAVQASVDRVFIWLIVFALLLLVGIPTSAFVNRRARRRQDGAA